jgi:hypothetical protein
MAETEITVTIAPPLIELLRSQQQEISIYKWIESKHVGYDIGIERATAEWIDRHFLDWVSAHRQLIDKAFAAVAR